METQENINSVQGLFYQLCKYLNKGQQKYDIKKMQSKLFEILLKFTSTPRNAMNDSNLNDLDLFYTELYFMQNYRQFDRANQLYTLLLKLKDQNGEISVEFLQFLRFILCLSSWSTQPLPKLGGPWKIPNHKLNIELCDISQYPSLYGDTKMYKPSFYYTQYPSDVFESVTPLPIEGRDSLNNQVFEASPGFDDFGNSLFGCITRKSQKLPSKLSSSHLFGACHQVQSSRPNSLLLPVLTSQSAMRPMLFTLTKTDSFSPVEDSDTSVDEGFVDLDCDGVVSPSDPSQIWETVSKLHPKKIIRSWDRRHRLTDFKDRLYLCQSGSMGGQVLYLSRLHSLQLLDPQGGEQKTTNWLNTSQQLTHDKLIKDIVNLLLGVPSSTFMFDKQSHLFRMRDAINVPGLAVEPLSQVLEDFLECGSLYLKLEAFALPEVLGTYLSNGLVVERLKEGVSQYLQHYRGCILYAKETQSSTLLTLHQCVHKAYRQLRYLTDLCLGDRQLLSRIGQQSTPPKGLKLLTWLFQHAVQEWGGENDLLLMFLLKTACTPYLKFLHDWVFEGTMNDPYSEFNIQVNENCLTNQNDKSLFWSHGYVLKEKMSSVSFLGDIVTQSVLLCGKSLNLLKICDPKHSLLDSRHPRPNISLSFTTSDLVKSTEDSHTYFNSLNTLLFAPKTPKPDVPLPSTASDLKILKSDRVNDGVIATQSGKLENDVIIENMNVERVASAPVKDPDETSDVEDPLSEITNQVKTELISHYSQLMRDAETEEQKLLLQAKRFDLLAKRLHPTEAEKHPTDLGAHSVSEISFHECPTNESKEINFNVSEKTEPINKDTYLESDIIKPICEEINKDTFMELSNSENLVEVANNDIVSELIGTQTISSESIHSHTFLDVIKPDDKECLGYILPGISESSEPELICDKGTLESTFVESIPVVQNTNTENENISEDLTINEHLEPQTLEMERNTPFPCAQPYQMEFPNLCALPQEGLLLSLNMFGPTREWDEDQEADCLSVPLAVFFQRSLEPPLQAQARLVNQAVLCHFKEHLQLQEHFVALRNFFFFNDGEFGRLLSHLIFKKASTVSHYRDLLNPFYLHSILNTALGSCYSGDSPQADNLCLGLKLGCNTLPSPGFPVLMNLEMNYKVEWPLDIVVSEESEELYNRIFSFLLQVKHVIWTLTNSWYHLKQSDQLYHLSNQWQFRQIQIFRHEMLHFAQTVHEYVCCQILQVSWKEFQLELDEKVQDLDQFRNAHLCYLQKACTRCMLGGGVDISLQRSMDMAFQLTLHFHSQLLSLPWQQGIPLAEATFARMVNTHQHFKHQTLVLCKDWLHTSQH